MLPELEKISLEAADHNSPEVRRTFSFLPIRCLLGFQTLLHEFRHHAVYRHMPAWLSRRSTPLSIAIPLDCCLSNM